MGEVLFLKYAGLLDVIIARGKSRSFDLTVAVERLAAQNGHAGKSITTLNRWKWREETLTFETFSVNQSTPD